MRCAWLLTGLVLLLVWTGAAAGAVALHASSATVAAPGDTADLCVALGSGGADVAGTQNDLNWDGNCASLSGPDSCSVAGSHGKQLSTATKCGDFCLRAILLSFSDVDPIPDGELYCCRFNVEAAPGGCCQVAVVNSGASDPNGHGLSVSGNVAHLCVAAGGEGGTPTPTPTVQPDSSSDDDGCQVSPATAHGFLGPSTLALAILLGAVRRSVARASGHRLW